MESTLLDLAAKCEAATGPSDELDCLIHRAAYPDKRVMFDHGKAFGPGPKRAASYGRLADFPMIDWDDWHGVAMHIDAKPVTASLDAAMSLVPEGHGFGVTRHPHDGTGRAWCLSKWKSNPLGTVAATPALALTAACLRARAAS